MSSQVTPSKRRLSQCFEHTSPISKMEFISGEHVNTFVFLKCNVTNVNNPKLTELAMIAVSKEDLLHDGYGDGFMADGNLRYKDILVLAFDPLERIEAQDGANSDLTLENLRDSESKRFNTDSVHAINNFLQKQNKPVCVVAHNGMSVDFKVLRKECRTLNMTICGGHAIKLLCADALWMFHGIDHPVNEISNSVKRILFSEPDGAGEGKQGGENIHMLSNQMGQPSMLDHARYSFENVYRRYCGKFPDAEPRSAKYYAQCLLEICRKIPENSFCMIPCRNFPHHTSNNTSPPKLRKNESSPLLNNDRGPSSCITEKPLGDTVQTYVFLDLETTGLDVNVCGIAELCMIAVHRSHLGMINVGEANDVPAVHHSIIPRILNECSLMIRPLDDISAEASRINGLTTEGFDARGISCFTRRIAGILEDFLNRQTKPICLVSHNGDRFDFPILELHLKRAQAQHQIWSEIHCVDTYVGLRELVNRTSYGLNATYQDLVGDFDVHPPAHTAEGDVLRMISVVKMLPENLLKWMDENKRLFRQHG